MHRLLRIAGVALGLGLLVWALSRFVRIEALFEHFGAITAYVRAHFALAILLYMLVYVAVVVFSLPVALAMSLTGGALFGGIPAGLATLIAATLGATLLFLAARGFLHGYFVRKTESRLGGLRREFQADAASYLLMLRLTPVFPFVVVNLAAGLLGARLSTFVWTTLVGILPGTFVFCFIGSGLSGVLESEAGRLAACRASGAAQCPVSFDPSVFVSREIILGLSGLGLLVLVSLAVRRIRRRQAPT